MHAAFKAGRMGKDPATFWYAGELGFFDNYIIPLGTSSSLPLPHVSCPAWTHASHLFCAPSVSHLRTAAKKLKDCNVFGVSSDECLNYALMNRKEWEQKGEQVVEELVRKVNGLPEPSTDSIQDQLPQHSLRCLPLPTRVEVHGGGHGLGHHLVGHLSVLQFIVFLLSEPPPNFSPALAPLV